MGRFVVRLGLCALALTAEVRVSADGGPRFIRDQGGLAVIEHDGSNYDKLDPDGNLNIDPRARVVSEFIRTHGDFYDFVVIFANFDFDFGNLDGFYLGVRNDVQGVNIPAFDNGSRFGSPGHLQGVIQMAPLNHYRQGPLSLDPKDPRFRSTVGVVAHEIGHRWLAKVRFLRGAEVSADLLGLEASHWSYLLSSDASFMYGSRWKPGADGTFTAVEVESRFSPLDLYLMGFVQPEEVPPFTLLRNPDVRPDQVPELGARIVAAPETVSIEQVLAAEGARLPAAFRSQKNFNLAFVFLTKKDIIPSAEDLAAVEAIRSAFVSTFFSATLGRAYVDTDLVSVTPPDRAVQPDLARGLAWLLAQQKSDGRWEDSPPSSLRDTAVVLEALAALGLRGEEPAAGLDWISRQQPASVDFLARAMMVGVPHPLATFLLRQNSDGGFGIGPGYRSDPLDTALALTALSRMASPASTRRLAALFLVSSQLADGSWPSVRGGEGDLLGTYDAVVALQAVAAELTDVGVIPAIQRALAFLVSRQQVDGGFGDGPSTPYATAEVVEVLQAGGAPLPAIDAALTYLSRTQREDGSWNGSAFQTAAVLKTLVPASLANLSIEPSEIVLSPDPPEVGERVTVEVTVRNRSRVAAPAAFQVELFDGDPEAGGEPIGSSVEIAELGAGASARARFEWDTSGREGPHTLFAVADLAGIVPEASKTDNVATRATEVLPPLPNLVPETLTVTPPNPPEGASVQLVARIANRGSALAPTSVVRFYDGPPVLAILLDEVALAALGPGETAEAVGTWSPATGLGPHDIYSVVDPANAVRERKEADNRIFRRAEVRVPPPVEPDLLVSALSLTPNRLQRLPQPVTLRAVIQNTGTTPVPSATVELYLGDPDSGGLKLDQQSVAVPGDGSVEVAFNFTVTGPGTKTYFVAVRANAVVERDESNNKASATLVDPGDTVEVVLLRASLSGRTLIAGETLTVTVDVANGGTRALSSVPVALFVEHETTELASSLNLPLAPGEVRTISLFWKANRLGDIGIRVKADPFGVLSELDEANNEASDAVRVSESDRPNLLVESTGIEVLPEPLFEGQTGAVAARVKNVGSFDAGPFDVAFFAGDPARGGVFIGQASVSALSARSDIRVEVSWPDVTVRGQQLIYAVADVGARVDEFSEEDNLSFKVTEIVGLPDLLSTSAQLRIEPPFPRGGDPVTIHAAFSNLGQQDAGAFRVELRLDDPLAGEILGSSSFTTLGRGDTAELTVPWSTPAASGDHAVFLMLDVAKEVREQSEDNNFNRLTVALQDGKSYVSPVYFSPNGDGIQDEATLFYRLDGAESASVRIVDEERLTVRELVKEGPASGAAIWDGRSEAGVLVDDGPYFFVLSSDKGEEITRRVVLDTNRSSIVEALGTPFLALRNLTCELPPASSFLFSSFLNGPAWSPDDGTAYFIVPFESSRAIGLYQVDADGSNLEEVKTGAEFRGVGFHDEFGIHPPRVVSPDGKRAITGNRSLVDLATSELTPLPPDAIYVRWSPEGSRLLVAGFNGLSVLAKDASFLAHLVQDAFVDVAEWSPDGRQIAYHKSEDTLLRLMDASGSEDTALQASDAANFGVTGRVVKASILWSRDGKKIYFTYDHEVGLEDIATLGPIELDLSTADTRPIDLGFAISRDKRWYLDRTAGFYVARRLDGQEARPVLPVSEGFFLRWSYRDNFITYRGTDAASPPECPGKPDVWALGSLLNGSAELRLSRLPSGFGVRITGTAADLNLDRYTLEFAPTARPDTFQPIQPPAIAPVANDLLTTWIPPGPGDYLVRLTVRDKAGNSTSRLERIFWQESLPIAGLRRSPEHISPNADGVQDAAVFEYTVLDRANLEFHVRDQAGHVLRTILRDEDGTEPSASFAWDGTDDGGSRVPDGVYFVELRGAEYRVVVDTTPPEARGRYSQLYNGGGLVADLMARVTDVNLREWRVKTEEEELQFGARPVEGEEGADGLVRRVPARQETVLSVIDLAGNTTEVPLLGPAREIRWMSLQGRSVGPFKPGPPEAPPPGRLAPDTVYSLAARASFKAENMVFRYQKVGDSSFIELPAGPGNVLLDTSTLDPLASYVGYFEANGVRSLPWGFGIGVGEVLILHASYDPLAKHISIASESFIREPLVEATLMLYIRNKPPRELRVYRPFTGFITDTVPALLSCLDDASVQLIARGLSGKLYPSNPPDPKKSGPTPVSVGTCLGVDSAEVQKQAACGAVLPKQALVRVSGSNLPAPAISVALLAEGAGLPLTEVARSPASGVQLSLQIPWDVSAVPEGEYLLHARASLADSTVVEGKFALSLFLDQSPPTALFESPPEGGNACIVTVEGQEYVEIVVVARDHSLIEPFLLERLVRSSPEVWEPDKFKPVEETDLGDGKRLRLLVPLPRAFEGPMTLRWTVDSHRISIGPVDINRKDPEIKGAKPSGSLESCTVRRFLVVRTEPLGPLTVEPPSPAPRSPTFISPNGDARADKAIVRGDLAELAKVSAKVVVAGGATVRTLLSDTPFGAGALAIDWDGKDDLGLVVPDGLYTVVVAAVNGCGTRVERQIALIVDNTPPQARIDAPTPNQQVVTLVEVVGVANDLNFLRYVLEAGEGDAPATFVRILEWPAPVDGRSLGLWDVGALVGRHTLRLTVEDRAANLASASVTVDVQPPKLIERFSTPSSLFSPNADGTRDKAEIDFRLKRDARLTLEIRDSADRRITRLVDGESRLAGVDYRSSWDGSGAPDGNYVALLTAEDAALPEVREEAQLMLVLDATAPALQVESPRPGAFILPPSEVAGSVDDANLEGFRVEIRTNAGALVFVEQGTRAASPVLAKLPGLGDDSYRLEVRATDLAGNHSEVTFGFTVDATPPRLAIDIPAEGAFLKPSESPVRVLGSVAEANLEAYTLEFGRGSPPRALVPLAGGATAGDVAVDWGLTDLPDGLYTLRLSARDRAGNSAQEVRVVTLDGTPPVALITQPLDGGFLTAASPVLGTASDTNLEGYVLEIAPGDPATAFQFSEISRGTAAVSGGPLHPALSLEDGPYTLRLTVTDRAGHGTERRRGFLFDARPPVAPVGLTATVEGRDDVRLSWQPNTESDIAGYLVFRDGILLTPTPISNRELLDSDRPEGRYIYTVKAVDRAGLQSEPSSPADAIVDLTPPLVDLRAPEDGASVSGLVDVSGAAFSDSDFQEFRLTVAPVGAPQSLSLLRRSSAPISASLLAQWDTTLLEGSFIIRLEAEDVRGNLAFEEARVTIDHQPPDAPVLTRAEPSEDDIEVEWQTVTAPDLAGYLLFRNRQIANAPGPIAGDKRPFLLSATRYLDADRPDGRFCYVVAAMDRAGNLSPDSNEICVVLDNRAPSALVFDPEDGARFDRPRQVRAIAVDQDVASVLFQYRREADVAWTDIGADAQSPYEVVWDVTGLAFGPYRLRALASDATRSDPNPASIRVTLDDATPPPVPANLTARVRGDEVSLRWEAVAAPDLAGYKLYRDSVLIGTLDPAVTSHVDAGLADGRYVYTVTSFDEKQNESRPSGPASARVYAPLVRQPFPIYEQSLIDLAGTGAEPEATVRLEPVGLEAVADSSGSFSFTAVSLPVGTHVLLARATDAAGNQSRPSASVVLVHNLPPSSPANLTGSASDTAADLVWDPVAEPDLSGYFVQRAGVRLQREGPIGTGLSATASTNPDSAFAALDGDPLNSWFSETLGPSSPEWLEIGIDPPRHVREVRIAWGFISSFASGARDYRVLAEIDGQLVEVASQKGNDSPSNQHRFPFAFRTARIRIEGSALQDEETSSLGIAEVTLIGDEPLPGTSFTDTPPRAGIYAYTVVARDVYGGESAAAGPLTLTVGDPVDREPPPPPEFVFPATADSPATVFSPHTDVVGLSEPGALVDLARNGGAVGEAFAEESFREQWRVGSFLINQPAEQFGVARAAALAAVAEDNLLRVYDLRFGTESSFSFAGFSPLGVSFSPRGNRVALTAFHVFTADLHVFDLATGRSQTFPTNPLEAWPVWLSDAEIVMRRDGSIIIFNLNTQQAVERYRGSSPEGLRLSPAATHLAFTEGDSMKILNLSSGAVTAVASGVPYVDFDWIAADQIVYAKSGQDLTIYDVTRESSTALLGTAGADRPRARPDGRISFLRAEGDGFALYSLERGGGAATRLSDLGPRASFFAAVEWSPDLRFLEADGDFLTPGFLAASLPAGRFEVPSVALEPGENIFVAEARDAAGNVSAPSAPARVVLDTASLPDLVVEEIRIVPAVPLAGESASVMVRVANRGASDSQSALAQARGRDVSGNLYVVGTASVPALAPGATTALSFAWDTTGRVGANEITVEVDALRSVEEADEANNLSSIPVTVVVSTELQIAVSTGLPAYGAGEDVQIDVDLVNGGAELSLSVETVIEDAGGALVERVDARGMTIGYGESRRFTLFWNTGNHLAGEYRLRVTGLEEGAPRGASTAPFTIRPTVRVLAKVNAGKPTYTQGESVELFGRVTSSGSNVALRDLLGRFQILNAAGASVFEATAPIAYLALEGTVTIAAEWASAAPAPGDYTIRLEVSDAAGVLATATAPLGILAPSGADLAGVLEPAASAVPRGGAVQASFRVVNRGLAPLVGGLVRVRLIDPRSGLTVASEEFPADIGAGGEMAGSVSLATDGASFGQHVLVLSAGPPTEIGALASELVTLFGAPSAPSLNAPAEGASASQPLQLSVNNGSSPNGLPLTYTFEIYLDPELRLGVASASGVPEGAAATAWEVPIRLEENTRYYWRASAEDRLAGSEWMSPASFFLDSLNEPPGEPTLSAPAAGSEVSVVRPTLEVGNAVDPEGAALVYTFEVYSDPELTTPVAAVSVPGGDGTTAIVVPVALEEDRAYFWRARANDGALDGPWMPVASFRVNTGNQAPSAPTPRSPRGSSPTASPDLVAGPALDPEGENLTYTFEIDESAAFDSPSLQRTDGVAPGVGEVRWTVRQPLQENLKYYWRARATDGLAPGDWSEVATFRVNQANEAPSTPALQRPTGGILVTTLTPALTLINSADPEEDVLTYDFEVYSDAALTEKVAGIDGVRQGERETSWVTSPRLDEDKTFYWRARASDGALASPWSPSERFRVNTMNSTPTAPMLEAPADGARVGDVNPILIVRNGADPDGDVLSYRFEVYEDELLTVPIEKSPPVAEGVDRTSWQVSHALSENAIYYWRAQAFDGELFSSWMRTARFRFSPVNEAPGVPVLLSPADGTEVAEARPLLTLKNASDPDGDPLRYVFEVYADPSLSDLVASSPEQEEGNGTTAWRVDRDLAENGVFYWRAFATDGLLSGAPSSAFSFKVNATRERPTAPTPIEPPDGSEVGTTSVRLVVRNATSPDGLGLRYHFQIATDVDFLQILAENPDVPRTPDTTGWDIARELANGVTYFWRASAIDEGDLESDWSSVFRFTVVLPTPGCPPEWREDFEKAPPHPILEGWQLRVDEGHPHFHIERHDHTRWLASVPSGEGALVFVGSGESRGWRNYAFSGKIRVNRQHDEDDDEDEEEEDEETSRHSSTKGSCSYGAGVVFYADLERDAEYRLWIAGRCERPELRLVKRIGGVNLTLAATPVDIGKKTTRLRFYVETLNLPEETSIRARVWQEGDREWRIEALDSAEPLRRGSVGAWSDHSRTLWDDFLVEGLAGLESGISGDEDGDGVCDNEECPGRSEVCLDEGFKRNKGLSSWVVAAGGARGHSGPSACGAKHSYWIAKRSGFLVAETPELAGGLYRFQLLLERRTHHPLRVRVVFSDRQIFEISAAPSFPHHAFAWSEPVMISLPAGVSRFRIESIEKQAVHVEAFRMERPCER